MISLEKGLADGVAEGAADRDAQAALKGQLFTVQFFDHPEIYPIALVASKNMSESSDGISWGGVRLS